MSTRGDADHLRGAGSLPPPELAERLRDVAALLAWQDVLGTCSIQRFSRLPSAIDLPGHSDDVPIGHLADPFFVEADGPGAFDYPAPAGPPGAIPSLLNAECWVHP